ncbi:MAG: glycosyl hydrolase, partial [Paludibacter sp.]
MRVLTFSVFHIVVFISLMLSGCTKSNNKYQQGSITKFDNLIKEFKKPSKEYGTIPFFVWNGDITKEGIDEKMLDFKNAGCGGVIVHPRPGLITEYLSDKWFELFRYTVDKGKELDMNVWIYDENSYPSGFAGGHVPAQMPESYNQGQGLQPTDTITIPRNYSKYFLILKNENGKYNDITATAQNELGKTGEYILISKTYYNKSGWFGGFSYVDLLYPGVTQKFLEVTMPGYQKVAGDEFGKTVQGVFTDEPEISSPGGIRWTPDLFAVFQKQWGYDLKLTLPSLWKEVGDWKKVRHNYTQTLLKLFIERWSKPASEYYEKNGLKFTGHYWEHGWPSMRLGGDNMAMYAYHQVPAIDMLFNQFDEVSPNAQFGNIRSVKELASVANQFGRKRTLSETYGGAGWEITFKDLKRLGDWEYVLGVNTMNQHLSWYTMAGARKYDYPPSFSYHNPWWKSYKYLNDHYARLSLALSSGKQENSILVIEPTTTAWLYDSYMNNGRNASFNEIGKSFQWFVTTLEKNQIEYDLGSEDIIRNHGKSDKTGFTVGQRTYSIVVVPPLSETLDKATFQLIKQFVADGGKLLSFSAPTMIDGAQNQEVTEFFRKEATNIIHIPELNSQTIQSYFQCDNFKFENVTGGNLFHHRRIMEDGQILFLTNSSMDSVSTGSVIAEGKDAVLLNTFTGEVTDYKEVSEGKNIRISFSLSPAESLLLYISDKKLEGYKQPVEIRNTNLVVSKSKISVKRDDPNVLPIDFCNLQIGSKTLNDIHVSEASNTIYTENGFPKGDPWNHSVQYKTSILDRSVFDAKSGFVASY